MNSFQVARLDLRGGRGGLGEQRRRSRGGVGGAWMGLGALVDAELGAGAGAGEPGCAASRGGAGEAAMSLGRSRRASLHFRRLGRRRDDRHARLARLAAVAAEPEGDELWARQQWARREDAGIGIVRRAADPEGDHHLRSRGRSAGEAADRRRRSGC